MKKRDFETYQKRFWDFEILPEFFRDPRFSMYHSPPLLLKLANPNDGLLDHVDTLIHALTEIYGITWDRASFKRFLRKEGEKNASYIFFFSSHQLTLL